MKDVREEGLETGSLDRIADRSIVVVIGLGGCAVCWIWWQGSRRKRRRAAVVSASRCDAAARSVRRRRLRAGHGETATTAATTTARCADRHGRTTPKPAPHDHAPTRRRRRCRATTDRRVRTPPIERNARAATMTNSGHGGAARRRDGDAIRSHYDGWRTSSPRHATGNFTVQFELVCQPSSLTKAMQAGGSNVWFVPIATRAALLPRLLGALRDAGAKRERALDATFRDRCAGRRSRAVVQRAEEVATPPSSSWTCPGSSTAATSSARCAPTVHAVEAKRELARLVAVVRPRETDAVTCFFDGPEPPSFARHLGSTTSSSAAKRKADDVIIERASAARMDTS